MDRTILGIWALAFVGHLVCGTDLELLTSAVSNFSQDLYNEIAVAEKNVVYSPLSIHSCLSMASVGALGDTASEMKAVLGLTPLTDPHQVYRNLITEINNVTDVELYTANAIFLNPVVPILQSFVTAVETYYYATTDNFNLTAPGGPEKAVNDFIDDNTNGLFKNVLPPDTITADTVTVLVNTVFFNGTWAKVFPEHKTQKQNFHQLYGAPKQVDMMNDDRYIRIKRDVHGADVAEILFQGFRFALYIVLPRVNNGITLLEEKLAVPGNVDDFFEGLQFHYVKLAIPKFNITSGFMLNAPLKNLGMNKAFDPSAANFRGITFAFDAVYIGLVIHKARIEVKETGTVAAAVTVVSISGITSVGPSPPAELFVADHPFLFFLRDNETGTILFQGKFSG